MFDIEMCKNDACYDRQYCYRYRAKPTTDQKYAEFEPDHNGVCENFWDCREYVEKNLRSMKEIENFTSFDYRTSDGVYLRVRGND